MIALPTARVPRKPGFAAALSRGTGLGRSSPSRSCRCATPRRSRCARKKLCSCSYSGPSVVADSSTRDGFQPRGTAGSGYLTKFRSDHAQTAFDTLKYWSKRLYKYAIVALFKAPLTLEHLGHCPRRRKTANQIPYSARGTCV